MRGHDNKKESFIILRHLKTPFLKHTINLRLKNKTTAPDVCPKFSNNTILIFEQDA